MEWLNGLLINQFISNHLSNNNVLSDLQKKLVAISTDLENNNIGHGDIQCGNLIVIGTASSFQVKLIDYDGMYVPTLFNEKSIEKGRSEFQHPKRSINNFNPEMDRFSFWVMITALEALKIDKTLWREVMQGGFNTLDNFLFTIHDFLNPNQSELFNKLKAFNSVSLNFYLATLKWLCYSDYSVIPPPMLHENSSITGNSIPLGHFRQNNDQSIGNSIVSDTNFKVIVTTGTATVLTSTFLRLGSTPLELDKQTYSGKLIIVSNGKETKRITLNSFQDLIEVKFD
jgi:hypothetical protein